MIILFCKWLFFPWAISESLDLIIVINISILKRQVLQYSIFTAIVGHYFMKYQLYYFSGTTSVPLMNSLTELALLHITPGYFATNLNVPLAV